MNITRENTGELTATIKIAITQEDYKQNVDKAVKEYQKKTSFKGFRPGKVPVTLIQKLYGKTILADEVNKLLSDNLTKYISENNINILGQPLPNDEYNKSINFENQKDFDFYFDLGLSPEFELTIDDNIEILDYNIECSDEMVDKEIDYLKNRFGKYTNPDTAEDKDILHGEFAELDDNGNIKEGGIKNHANIALTHTKNNFIKSRTIGAKKGDKFIFNNEEFLSNLDEATYYLNLKKEELQNIKASFIFQVESVNRLQPAEMGSDFFNSAFPNGNISTEEDFRQKIKENLATSLKNESDNRLNRDIVDTLTHKHNFNLPEEFLKKWIKTNNEKISDEQIEKEFDDFLYHMKWDIIENRIIKENNIEVNDEELKDYARNHARQQLSSYGLSVESYPDTYLENFTENLLKKDDNIRKIYDNIYNKKVMELIKSKIKLTNNKISFDEFLKLENKHKHDN